MTGLLAMVVVSPTELSMAFCFGESLYANRMRGLHAKAPGCLFHGLCTGASRCSEVSAVHTHI